MVDVDDVGTALCRLDDWQHASVPLKTFELSLQSCDLDSIKSFLSSIKSGMKYYVAE
jgi:hypothetical protein